MPLLKLPIERHSNSFSKISCWKTWQKKVGNKGPWDRLTAEDTHMLWFTTECAWKAKACLFDMV